MHVSDFTTLPLLRSLQFLGFFPKFSLVVVSPLNMGSIRDPGYSSDCCFYQSLVAHKVIFVFFDALLSVGCVHALHELFTAHNFCSANYITGIRAVSVSVDYFLNAHCAHPVFFIVSFSYKYFYLKNFIVVFIYVFIYLFYFYYF